jgi:hypothetical protein
MNAQHTPGPWHYEMKTRYGHTSWDIYPPADLPTGSLIPIARGTNGHNARLIAAAPDLLDALRDLVAVTEQTYDNRHELAAALDAIERATGGAA